MTALASIAALAACVALPPAADRVTARDLAQIEPALAPLAPDTSFGYAPAPGVRRVFRAGELAREAARQGVPVSPLRDLCAERATAAIDPARLIAAMSRSLPDAQIEIVDFGRVAAPAGEIVFPARALAPPGNDGTALWRGYALYGARQRFPLWARVRVTVRRPRVVAVEAVPAGTVIAARHVRVETAAEFPPAAPALLSLDEAIGRAARRTLAPGQVLRPALLGPARAVARGDLVRVEARAGDARLEVEARAEANGAVGDRIPVRNPQNKRRFLARVDGPGRVTALGSLER